MITPTRSALSKRGIAAAARIRVTSMATVSFTPTRLAPSMGATAATARKRSRTMSIAAPDRTAKTFVPVRRGHFSFINHALIIGRPPSLDQ